MSGKGGGGGFAKKRPGGERRWDKRDKKPWKNKNLYSQTKVTH